MWHDYSAKFRFISDLHIIIYYVVTVRTLSLVPGDRSFLRFLSANLHKALSRFLLIYTRHKKINAILCEKVIAKSCNFIISSPANCYLPWQIIPRAQLSSFFYVPAFVQFVFFLPSHNNSCCLLFNRIEINYSYRDTRLIQIFLFFIADLWG